MANSERTGRVRPGTSSSLVGGQKGGTRLATFDGNKNVAPRIPSRSGAHGTRELGVGAYLLIRFIRLMPHNSSPVKTIVPRSISQGLLESLLSAWLGSHSSRTLTAQTDSTGLSGSCVWKVDTSEGAYCLKGWPSDRFPVHELARRHQLLTHLGENGFGLVPLPRRTSAGETIQSTDDWHWDLTSWKPGSPCERSRTDDTPLNTAVRCLARFHKAARNFEKPTVGASPGLQTRRTVVNDLSIGQHEHLIAALVDRQPSPYQEIGLRLHEQLVRTSPNVQQSLREFADMKLPLQWCLRDVKYDHVFFQGDEVSGLIDYGAAAIDSVAGDLARLLGSFLERQDPSWDRALEEYQDCSPLSVAERNAVWEFDRGGSVASAANWLRWIFLEGRYPNHCPKLQAHLEWLLLRLQYLQ